MSMGYSASIIMFVDVVSFTYWKEPKSFLDYLVDATTGQTTQNWSTQEIELLILQKSEANLRVGLIW